MAHLSFLQALGVTTFGEALAKWPSDRVQPTLGLIHDVTETATQFEDLMKYLEDAVRLHDVRPGAERLGMRLPIEPIRVGFTADLRIENPPDRKPLVLAQMTEVAFHLLDTGPIPAKLFVTHGRGGTELVLQGLPV